MGEKEDKEKAEKLAAARKRVAALQAKKKKEQAGGAGEASTPASEKKVKGKKGKKDKEPEEGTAVAGADEAVEEQADTDKNEVGKKVAEEEKPVESKETARDTSEDKKSGEPADEDEDADTAALNNAIKAANTTTSPSAEGPQSTGQTEEPAFTSSTAKSRSPPGRQPSVSLQSKIRSTSFRQASGAAPLSPSVLPDESAESLYRKQTLRIQELEEENKRLSKEASESEARWHKTEEELEELREKSVEQTSKSGDTDEIEKLRAEIEALRRSQRQSVSAGAGKGRTGSIPAGEDSELRKELENNESTISDLQLEISRLRSQLSSQTEGRETHGEQIAALQSNLERAEGSVRRLETELSDTKKALTRASEKAVIDGTERTSKETKIRSLEKGVEDLRSERDELKTKVDGLEKKVEAMNKLHREAEERANKKLSTAEAQAREAQTLRNKVEGLEKEIAHLREARKRTMSGGGGDDGLEELEDEERKRLERRVRELESEVFELRRGVWREKRRELQPGMTTAADQPEGDEFDEVDLSGSMPASRRRSSVSRQSQVRQHSGFTQVLNSGLAAFRAATTSPDSTQQQKNRPRNDSLLQEFDNDDMTFDENAFAAAQKEEEMRKMVEHVREVKRGLKKWVGWRLDLVDARRGGGGWGAGDVFEV